MSLKSALFGSGVMRVASAALTFLGSIVLARALGPAFYGDYVLIFSMITLAYFLSTAGLPNLVLREISHYSASNRHDLTKGMLVSAIVMFIVLLGLCAGLSGVAQLIGVEFGEAMGPLAWATVLLWGLAILLENATRGRGHTTIGQVGELLLRPGGIVVLLLIVQLMVGAGAVTVDMAVQVLFAATALSASFALVAFIRVQGVALRVKAAYQPAAWLRGGIYNSGVSVLIKSSFPLSFLMLGALASAEDLGIYRVAYQLAMAAGIGLLAAKAVMAPRFARSLTPDAQEDMGQVRWDAIKSCLIFSLPLCAILLTVPELILSFLFGSEFTEAAAAARILALTIIINSLFGPIDVELQVRRADRSLLVAAVLRVALYLGLVAVLITPFGITGVALAQLLSTTLWCLVMLLSLRQSKQVQALV